MILDDLPDILDADRLLQVGHGVEAVLWLLCHAVRGTPHHPYLTAEEYERLLPDLDGWRRDTP